MKTAAQSFSVAPVALPTGYSYTLSGHPVRAARRMGFEQLGRRRLAGVDRTIGSHRQYLFEYPELEGRWLDEDVCAEHVTWPDVIDQTTVARFCTARDFDDQEDDDPAGGDICDEPHDAREEDGI